MSKPCPNSIDIYACVEKMCCCCVPVCGLTRFFSREGNSGINFLTYLLNQIREKRLPKRFKAQDIYHQGLGGLSESVRVRAALDLLQDYGWVASEKEKGASGRHSEFWNELLRLKGIRQGIAILPPISVDVNLSQKNGLASDGSSLLERW